MKTPRTPKDGQTPPHRGHARHRAPRRLPSDLFPRAPDPARPRPAPRSTHGALCRACARLLPRPARLIRPPPGL